MWQIDFQRKKWEYIKKIVISASISIKRLNLERMNVLFKRVQKGPLGLPSGPIWHQSLNLISSGPFISQVSQNLLLQRNPYNHWTKGQLTWTQSQTTVSTYPSRPPSNIQNNHIPSTLVQRPSLWPKSLKPKILTKHYKATIKTTQDQSIKIHKLS